MRIALILIVLVSFLVAAVVVWHRRTRETDPGRIAAKSAVKEKTAALKAARSRRDREIAYVQKELNKTVKTRDAAIKRVQHELSDLRDPRGSRLGSYQGVTVYQLQIHTPHGKGSVAGVHASVDSQVSTRITATRLVTIGVFALAARKKTGAQFLSIDGPEVASVVQCPVEDSMKAREFAVKINNAARAAGVLIADRPARITAAEKRLARERDTTVVDHCRERLTTVQKNPELLKAIEDATAALTATQAHLDQLDPTAANQAASSALNAGAALMIGSATVPPTLSPGIANAWHSSLALSLAPDEVITAMAPIRHTSPSLDGLATTNWRIIAFDSKLIDTRTPQVSINLRSIASVEWLNALSGKRLQLVSKKGAKLLVGTVLQPNIDYVKAIVDSARNDADTVASVWIAKPPLVPRAKAS